MAKYTINYSCGHGTVEKELYGQGKDRERKIDWMQANMVCPDCYREIKIAEDAVAPKTAKICLVPASEPIISIEVDGQIEANKVALYDLGYQWSDSTSDGLFGFLSMAKPKRALTILARIESQEQIADWIKKQQNELVNLGYSIKDGLNAIDMSYLAKQLQAQQDNNDAKAAAQAKLAEIKANDPRPTMAPLRKRIAEIEEKTGKKWNGKIYGKPGRYNFYVNDVNYTATDDEVVEREQTLRAVKAWDAKYKDILEAAK